MEEQSRTYILEASDLSVSFETDAGEVQAVRDVSLSLKEGEVLAIVGESGCGKSVLCKSLMKMLPENARIKSGKILANGIDITGYKERDMAKLRGTLFSMVFQDPMTALNPTMTIGRQIEEAIKIHNPHIKRDALEKRVIELMGLVGIDQADERRNLYPYHFSGGMRQRSVLAIALAGNPSILIADEPTTALDVTIQAQILDLFRDIQKKMHTSTIFVTHDLGVVARVADRVAVMYAGKIVELGTTEDIFYDARHPSLGIRIQILQNIDRIIGIHLRNDSGSIFQVDLLQILCRILGIGKDFRNILLSKQRIEFFSFLRCHLLHCIRNVALMIIGDFFEQFFFSKIASE